MTVLLKNVIANHFVVVLNSLLHNHPKKSRINDSKVKSAETELLLVHANISLGKKFIRDNIFS
jgi:hypothetical protein